MRYLHGQSEEAITQALAPFGFYRPTMTHDLEEVDGVWQASYTIDPGDSILLKTVDILVTGEAGQDPAFADAISESTLMAGTPLMHEGYESLKQRFQVLASQRGYFDAVLKEGKIQIDLANYEAAVVLHFDSGTRYFLG